MPTSDQIQSYCASIPAPIDGIRVEYLKKLHECNGNRNIISYYSAFQQKQELSKQGFQGFGIDDLDMNSFMSVVHGMDRQKGLDLILHTPGGEVAATEALVSYLRELFDDNIRAFVPQMAMSAGTLICLATKEIIMGKQSSLGPIDPQIGGLAAESILAEYEEAKSAIEQQPDIYPFYKAQLENYPTTIIVECRNAIALAKMLAKEYLTEVMFKGTADENKIAAIVEHLSSHEQTKTHARHISAKRLINLGLKVTMLEGLQPIDPTPENKECDIQDLVLTIHHCYIQIMGASPLVKLVENHLGQMSAMTVNRTGI